MSNPLERSHEGTGLNEFVVSRRCLTEGPAILLVVHSRSVIGLDDILP
jgi:hypothetical protein